MGLNLPTSVKRVVKKVLRYPEPYQFFMSPSILQQTMKVDMFGHQRTISAGCDTTLYETICETIEFDAYQLARIPNDLLTGWVVDAGANVGVVSLALHAKFDQRLICIEPNPQNLTWLRQNLSQLPQENYVIHAAALTPNGGKVVFANPSRESVAGQVVNSTDVPPDSLEVDSMSLAQLLLTPELRERSIGILKLDIEGSEHEVFAALTAEMARRIQCISLEVHDLAPTRNLAGLTTKLHALGFTLHHYPNQFGRRWLHHLLAIRNEIA